MSVLSREELISKVSKYIGDKNDDDSISLLEDITDTFDGDGEDWKKKYEENDASWRKRYRERFENGNQVRKDEVQDELQRAQENGNVAEIDEIDGKEMEESIFKSEEKEGE